MVQTDCERFLLSITEPTQASVFPSTCTCNYTWVEDRGDTHRRHLPKLVHFHFLDASFTTRHACRHKSAGPIFRNQAWRAARNKHNQYRRAKEAKMNLAQYVAKSRLGGNRVEHQTKKHTQTYKMIHRLWSTDFVDRNPQTESCTPLLESSSAFRDLVRRQGTQCRWLKRFAGRLLTCVENASNVSHKGREMPLSTPNRKHHKNNEQF